MPSTPLSPVTKMSLPARTMSSESAEAIRKRVGKACDRCRLKKSKCDGSSPCSRCKADNSICVFGERKKSHDKVYPKGYVEMLEQQQSQLVAGLRDMYKRLSSAQQWNGPALSEASGHPLTHDILAALNLLVVKDDGSGEHEMFEDDPEKLQARLLANGASYVQRRGSISSESEHSPRAHSRSGSRVTALATHRPSGAALRDALAYTPSQSPLSQSPAQGHSQLAAAPPLPPPSTGSPLTAQFDPQFYQATWAAGAQAMLDSKAALMATTSAGTDDDGGDDDFLNAAGLDWYGSGQQLDFSMYDLSAFVAAPQPFLAADGAVSALDPMDLDLSRAPPPVAG